MKLDCTDQAYNEPADGAPILSTRCPNSHLCPCLVSRSYRIAAHNNAIGPGIIHYVPELLAASRRKDAIFGYCAPNDDRDQIGYSIRSAIARLERVKLQNVRITGSVLEFAGVLPAILKRGSVIKLTTDFRG